MTCKINADTTDGLKIVSDTSGVIDIQSDGTTSVSITPSQITMFGGTDSIVIAPSQITITDADSSQPRLLLKNTNADTSSAFLDFQKDSASPANDNIGIMRWIGDDAGGNEVVYATVFANSPDVTDGSEDGSFSIQTIANGTNATRLAIVNGNVGIGTAAPGRGLHVANTGQFDGGQNVGTMLTGTSGLGGVEIRSEANDDAAFMMLHRPGAYAAYLGIDTDNKLAFGGYSAGAALGAAKFGALSKTSGSFVIDHPLDSKKDTHNLVHSFIEGPQADLIYRGKVDLVGGSATINIDTTIGMTDGTFVALNTGVQCFTSNESGWTAVKGSVSGNVLTITAQDNSCTDTISWMVVGERHDPIMKDSNTDWTDDDGKVILEPLKTESAITSKVDMSGD